ncbi:MAG TPA: S41 family peptidase [Planctomycetaceae bacterium]|nr:S41 family peptidase [Planctomycetaceae bacterium]
MFHSTITRPVSHVAAATWRGWMAMGMVLFGTSVLSAQESFLAGHSAGSAMFESNRPDATAWGISNGTFPGFRTSPLNPGVSAPALDRTSPYHPRDPDVAPASAPAPARDSVGDAAKEIQDRISARYRNPVVVRLVQATSTAQALAVYREASTLIDSRHLDPASYEARVKRAVLNLVYASQNPDFLAANRLSPTSAQVQSFREAVLRLLESRPARSAADAQNMISWTSDLASRHLGLRATPVVFEFVFAAAESLDKYSGFEPEEPRRDLSASVLDDHVVGIGVEIKPHDDGIEVVKALREGPAARGGIVAGDIITQVNGRNLRGQSLDYAVDLIAGPAGSSLTVRILRDGRSSLLTLTRARVTVYSVSDVRMLGGPDKVGYVKLDKFAASTMDEVDRALWQLYQQGMKALVLDVRGNPGGLLTTAIALADKFLPAGEIVSTRGRSAGDNSSERARFEQTWKTPLVVLIDKDSASASEIFAAAIQENGRGLVVGERSFGKGTVQTHFPLRSVSGNLRLTTALFYSPRGRAMADAGVEPDIRVAGASILGGNDQALATAVRTAAGDQVRQMAASAPKQPAIANLSDWRLPQ